MKQKPNKSVLIEKNVIDPTCSSAIFVFPSQIFNVLSMRRKIVERIKSECFDELYPWEWHESYSVYIRWQIIRFI